MKLSSKTQDQDHDWDGCRCRTCGKIRDQDHDYVFIETDEEWVRSQAQGGVEWGFYEEVTIYRCSRCEREKKIGTGNIKVKQDGIV